MFRSFSVVIALVVGFGVCTLAGAADEVKAKAKKGGVAGVVTSVDKDSITIKVGGKKKGSDSAADEDKTFKINESTTYQTVSKGENGPETTDAKFEDVQKGAHVRITADGDVATKIEIMKGKKKE
jgi:hypothetical protein